MFHQLKSPKDESCMGSEKSPVRKFLEPLYLGHLNEEVHHKYTSEGNK